MWVTQLLRRNTAFPVALFLDGARDQTQSLLHLGKCSFTELQPQPSLTPFKPFILSPCLLSNWLLWLTLIFSKFFFLSLQINITRYFKPYHDICIIKQYVFERQKVVVNEIDLNSCPLAARSAFMKHTSSLGLLKCLMFKALKTLLGGFLATHAFMSCVNESE